VIRLLAVVTIASAASLSTGCSNACEELAERICACEPNRSSENACLLAVQSNSNRPIDPKELTVCERNLDTCTCEALEDDDLIACGLGQ